MREIHPVRQATIRLSGIALACVAGLAAVAGSAQAAPASAGHSACAWVVRTLPTVPTTDYAFSSVRGTDGDDTFAGSSNGHAVLWRGGRLVDLGVGNAADVNRSGDAVGFQVDGNEFTHATLFRAGTATRLAEPANATLTRATGINDDGLIVGAAEFWGTVGGTTHAVVWSASTPRSVLDLGVLDGEEAKATSLDGVNQGGMFIGNVVDQNTLNLTAVIGTSRGGLRALPGSRRDADTVAKAIAGRYIAGIEYVDGSVQPVRWLNGRPEALASDGEATGVNSHGTVVGRRSDLTAALIWTGVADPVELPVPTGLTQAGATAITDSGTVAGFGFNDASEQLPVLWSCR
jgi:uncharacterized membrane protein